MTEYQELGHMKLASNSSKPDCFLTHHNVIRPDSTTTKFRVVFNASAKTSTGNSLNDVMEAGPNLQQDLQSLILKWRQYKFAYTADIEKMFRQIWIHEDDQRYQKIVWRNTSSDPRRQNNPIQDYQLTTVTYGTKAAPFLSLMTLKQLARDERANNKNNLATDVLKNSFYVDDLLHESHSPESAKTLTRDLIKLLKSGGFNLRKWKSNVPELLEHIQTDNKTQDSFNFKQSEPSKTLGLIWDPKEDTFRFELKIELSTTPVTKRSLLSDISKLFDPLGWLSPLSTRLKIIFQKVWIHDIKWDDPLPKDILTDWISVRDTIYRVNQVQLPRWLGTQERDSIELHGFCDASQKAYACVIYCRIKGHKQSMPILLVGKTRLVPSSKSVSLPRLELSGALLLSKLISKVQQCLTNYNVTIYGWVDSMVVLGWLNGDPTRWKSFVANRVRQITNIMPTNCWQYVKSSENPADCASRGLTAAQLEDHSLWWKGPSWLSTYDAKKEPKLSNFTTNEEIKNNKLQVNVTQQNNDCSVIRDLISKYSSFTQLINVYARLLRYFKRLRLKQMVQTKHLSLREIRQAKMKLIKFVQETDFFEDIQNLQQGKPISNKSKILNLNPFLDQYGILRVGGRLNRANIDPQMKHPIILSKTCRLAELIIDESHFLTFHGGAQLTSAYTRQKYWIVGGIRAVKIRVRRCVKCRRHNPSNQHQIMGDLPPGKWAMGRVNQVHPGSDGYVRVVTLQTKNGSMRRPIFKLTPLPDFSDEEDKQVSTSDQSHQNIKTSPQLKTRTSQSLSSTYTTIVSLLLILLCLVCNVHSAYNIIQLQGNQANYFDKISEMNLIQDQWKIVVYYDMHPYWHGSKIFSIYMNHLENLCTQTKRRSHCDVIMLQLRHKFMELEYYDRMLLNQHFEAHTRTRRGLINGIGYVANSLFGVLDENFAEQYQKDITLVRKNQKHLALLWRNQTSIIEAENNLLKRVESTMEKQHTIFNQHLINLDQALSTLKNEVEKVAVTEDFILSTLIASNILSSLKNIQDSLLDTITNVQHFNVHLITPAQLQDELNIISNQLPKELSLPINSITTDLYKIYQIMQVRARMTREYFIFEIQIPLVNRESYEIYHMIPIQHQIKGSMVNVVLISEYIAINIRKDTYLPISGYELQKCIRLNANTNLCQLQKPIYQRDSDQHFRIKNQEGNTCTTITATCKTTWTQLNVINTFIITCCGHCTLRIICGDQVTTEQVTGVKIIALGNNCVIKGETFIITSHKQQTTNMKIKPDIIAVEIAPVNNLINLSIPTNEYKEERYQTSLQNISKQIEQMKAASEQTDDGVTYHDVHHYVAIYCVGVAGLAFAAFAYIRSRRRRRTVQLALTPAQPGVHYRASTSDLRATSMPNQSDQCASEVYHSDQRASVTNNSNACVTDRATSPVIRKCSFKTSTNNLAI